MASGENILWIVEKSDYMARIKRRFVFRTQRAASQFRKEQLNKINNKFNYSRPLRCVWGPEQ